MSKRVSNKKGSQRVAPARSGRIRIGFHKRKAAKQLEELQEAHEKGELDEEGTQKFMEYKTRMLRELPKRFIPKSLLRRSQNR